MRRNNRAASCWDVCSRSLDINELIVWTLSLYQCRKMSTRRESYNDNTHTVDGLFPRGGGTKQGNSLVVMSSPVARSQHVIRLIKFTPGLYGTSGGGTRREVGGHLAAVIASGVN